MSKIQNAKIVNGKIEWGKGTFELPDESDAFEDFNKMMAITRLVPMTPETKDAIEVVRRGLRELRERRSGRK